ncbi:MAG: phosphoglucosamine mutase [Gammaproteobacteria bacterium]|nr:MAG: phosphoglucosamine mutase [Gammaproteobacteria bacterium]
MRQSKRYFGTDGIRGTVGKPPVTPDFMLKLGWAAGRVLARGGGGKVLIGKDTRISGYMFESALEAGLSAAGVDIALLGPMPTPAIAYLTQTLHARAGIVISASHNDYLDNGIKFFSGDGSKLADDVECAIERELDKEMSAVSADKLGKAARVDDAPGRYIEFCKSTVPKRGNLRGLKVVVDCAHGATYHVAPSVFDELGAEVTAIGIEPDGFNINRGCGSTATAALRDAVIETGADLGIAFDGDGDRVLMVDHEGQGVDGDELLFIIAEGRRAAGLGDTAICGTVMSNLGLEEALRTRGIELKRASVGDRYVLELMKRHGLRLGGEASGHIICRDHVTTGDGIVSALQVLAEIKRTGETLKTLRQGMSKYPQILLNVPMPVRVDVVSMPPVVAAIEAAETSLSGAGRVLLRASGTEPLLRIMVEGPIREEVEAQAGLLADTVEAALASAQPSAQA